MGEVTSENNRLHQAQVSGNTALNKLTVKLKSFTPYFRWIFDHKSISGVLIVALVDTVAKKAM